MKAVCVALVLCTFALAQQTIKVTSPCESTRQVLSPTGKQLAVECKNGSVHLLELPDGREIRARASGGRISACEFSPDGRLLGLGTASGEIEVWSTASDSEPLIWKTANSVDMLKLAAGRPIMLTGDSLETNEVWDFSRAPSRKATLANDFATFTSGAFSPDGKVLVTTGGDTVIRFFDTDNWKLLRENRDLLLEPFSVAFTADGKYVVIGGADGQLTMLDAATAKTVRKFPAQKDPVWELHAVDAKRMAALYLDVDGREPPHLELWDLESGQSTPLAMNPDVTGGGVADGKIWMVKAKPNEIEVSSGN